MDAPRTLFEALKDGEFELLKQWVDERRLEDLYLDFKLAQSPMDKGGKQTLAEAVSGFANSEGGIIIWGVYAAKDPEEGVDGALELRPISDLKVFMSNLYEYTSRLVVPAPSGVEHHRILDPKTPDAGYVVTLVPKAEGLPHMAMGKGQQRYYFRSGDSFLPMEHFMLADRFGRRPQPKLRLVRRYESDGIKTLMVLGLENVGKGVSLFPALHIEERQGDINCRIGPLDPTRMQFRRDPGYGLPERLASPRIPSERWRMFTGGADDAIHPGTSLDILTLHFQISPNADIVPFEVLIRYALHCDGFSLIDQTKVIPGDEVVHAAKDPNFQPLNDD